MIKVVGSFFFFLFLCANKFFSFEYLNFILNNILFFYFYLFQNFVCQFEIFLFPSIASLLFIVYFIFLPNTFKLSPWQGDTEFGDFYKVTFYNFLFDCHFRCLILVFQLCKGTPPFLSVHGW